MNFKLKTSELTGVQLDWAAAKALKHEIKLNPGHGFFIRSDEGWDYFSPSSTSEDAVSLLVQSGMYVNPFSAMDGSQAAISIGGPHGWQAAVSVHSAFGPTLEIAVVRCFILSVLGHTVEIPEEII